MQTSEIVRLLRLRQIIGDPNADPPIPPIIPVSKSTWWAGVKAGRFPQPIKLGPRTTAWRVEDIGALATNSSKPKTTKRLILEIGFS